MSLCTGKLQAILTTLGGNPASLPNNLDCTLIDAIVAQLNTNVTGRTPTAAEVVTAIQGMNETQIAAVKTVLGIT